MPARIEWAVDNADPSVVPSLEASCGRSGGTLIKTPNADGTISVACVITSAAAPAPTVAAMPASIIPTPAVPAPLGAATPPTVIPATVAPAPAPAIIPTAVPIAAHATATSVTLPPISGHKRDTDLSKLHPTVRKAVEAIQKQLDKEKIPMRVFEAYRYPERQAHLYAKGRTTAGSKVTNAEPWESYHQYGLAADFVRFENGGWNWNTKTATEKNQWTRFHEIARENGMEPLSWELPHVQIEDGSLTSFQNGDYPGNGDDSWAEHLSAVIERWGAGAPPAPEAASRPAMAAPAIVASTSSAGGGMSWHSMFGGDSWAFDQSGVYTRDHSGGLKKWRTAGAPITTQEVIAQHGDAIKTASNRHGVAVELIVMTIATETAIYRKHGFTGPNTWRWEQGYTVNATGDPQLDGKEKGDYSAGPMQVMADTGRWMNDLNGMGYSNANDFKFYKNKPTKAPLQVGLYDPGICIDVGTAYIKHQLPKTGGDPLLVAAAYNAGGLYPSSGNRWRIRSHGNHIDRAAEWYGDACFVLYG